MLNRFFVVSVGFSGLGVAAASLGGSMMLLADSNTDGRADAVLDEIEGGLVGEKLSTVNYTAPGA